MMAPINWDGESYCVEDGCERPAAHFRLVEGREDPNELPVSEAVCCEHAQVEVDA